MAPLVLGMSKAQVSTRATRSWAARSDSAERRASWIIFFGSSGRTSGLGPEGHASTDPLGRPGRTLSGPSGPLLAERLGPTARTSDRVFVDWVPERAAASCAVTTWWSTARLGSMPKIDGSRSTEPSSAPDEDRRVTERCWVRDGGTGGSPREWPSPGRWSRWRTRLRSSGLPTLHQRALTASRRITMPPRDRGPLL